MMHPLQGCRARPLGSYLRALGVLRLVSEQADPGARGAWREGSFVLHTELSWEALLGFFVERWAPSAVISPWNGGGGFYLGRDSSDQRTKEHAASRALTAVERSQADRLSAMRRAIEIARRVLADLGLEEAPKEQRKVELIGRLRDRLGDGALAWLDAGVMLTDGGVAMPPLLGTGGNDGRLDFSSNFQQRLAKVFDLETGAPASGSRALLEASLSGTPTRGCANAAVGQFDPAASGGFNQGAGFSGRATVNAWDFLLMLEGALLLAGAATRRLESLEPGQLAYPFSVRLSAAGYGSATEADVAACRSEQWLPIWAAPASLPELQALFGEGRVSVGRRAAIHGVDFARAVGSLGVARGIDAFERYGFQQRNGKSFFAVPLGRWRVRRNANLELIDGRLDGWLRDLRRAASGSNAATSWRRGLSRVERALLALAADGNPSTTMALLAALARAEAAFGRSPAGRAALWPVPALGSGWARAVDDGSVTLRLARALASTPVRERLSHARWTASGRGTTWCAEEDHRTAWGSLRLEAGLLATVRRALTERSMRATAPEAAPTGARLSDVCLFLDGGLDDAQLESQVRALALVNPRHLRGGGGAGRVFAAPADLGLLALAHHRRVPAGGTMEPLPPTPGLLESLAGGRPLQALALACRRLSGAGLEPRIAAHPIPPARGRRLAASLAFPLTDESLRALAAACTFALERTA